MHQGSRTMEAAASLVRLVDWNIDRHPDSTAGVTAPMSNGQLLSTQVRWESGLTVGFLEQCRHSWGLFNRWGDVPCPHVARLAYVQEDNEKCVAVCCVAEIKSHIGRYETSSINPASLHTGQRGLKAGRRRRFSVLSWCFNL